MGNKCLIIGLGSIGRRHAEILQQIGMDVFIVSSRDDHEYNTFASIGSALAEYRFHYVVVSRETSLHYSTLEELKKNGFKGKILVEKPLFESMKPSFDSPDNIFVGYNLRFHPILEKIKSIIKGVPLYSMHVYCGQYLPNWRPGYDYRSCYSSSKNRGGGVLRDLSHELDYILWLTGPWISVCAKGGNASRLEIDSEDIFCLLAQTKDCPYITLQVNYFDICTKRELLINGENLSLKADLINNELEINGEKTNFTIHRNDTYLKMHEEIISGGIKNACTIEEGINVLELIEAAWRSSREDIWIRKN